MSKPIDDHTALLQAQALINFPKKDKQRGVWIVEYHQGRIMKSEEFQNDGDAYIFFYHKLAELKASILENQNVRG